MLMDSTVETKHPGGRRRGGTNDNAKALTNERITEALTDRCGHITLAAQDLGVDRHTLSKRLTPEHKELIDTFIQQALDYAEHGMIRMVMAGNPRAIEFMLRLRGGSRGWGERQEVKLGGSITNRNIEEKREGISALLRKLQGGAAPRDGS